MQKQKTETQEPSHQGPRKQPYEPPNAIFVALRLEERLTGCGDVVHPCTTQTGGVVGCGSMAN